MKMIIAVNLNGAIGKDGSLPWRSSADLKHFKAMTLNKTCLVGRKTFESLPPLKDRTLIVVGSGDGQYKTIDEAIAQNEIDWVIGGKSIYEQTLDLCSELHISVINDDTEGDVSSPDLSKFKGEVFKYNFEINQK